MRHELESPECTSPHSRLHASYFLLGAVVGAAAMFLLDPLGGRRRRKLLNDKLVSGVRRTRATVVGYGTNLGLHARGAAHELRARATEGAIPDQQLVDRVRSQLGRGVHHVRQVCVSAHDGVVTLSGCALRDEASALMANVERVRGVRGVECQLRLFISPEEFPTSQPRSTAAMSAFGPSIARHAPSVPNTSAG
jgi:hypothetical protein